MDTPRIASSLLALVLAFAVGAPAEAQRSSGGGGKPGKTTTADTVPPELRVPGDLRAEASAPGGALIQYAVSASDNLDRRTSAACSPASGTVFPLGRTQVDCEARDSAGNLAVASFGVSVVDTTVPTIGLPGPLSVVAEDSAGAAVDFTVSATDRVDPSPALSCTRASGSLFPVGDTRVQCTAQDASGNLSDGSFVVSVSTTTAGTPDPDPAPQPDPDPVLSGTAALSWSVPTTRANGSPLAPGELAGYEIYVLSESTGESSVITINDPMTTRYTVNGLPVDVYHFAVGAVDTGGLVSELSAVVSKDLR